MSNNTVISQKALVADLRRVKQGLGKKSLTRRVYRSLGNHASSTIEDRMGSWSVAKRVAGIR